MEGGGACFRTPIVAVLVLKIASRLSWRLRLFLLQIDLHGYIWGLATASNFVLR